MVLCRDDWTNVEQVFWGFAKNQGLIAQHCVCPLKAIPDCHI